MMLVYNCLLLFVLAARISDCRGAGVRRSFSYTLHTTPATWNEALNICVDAGETLVYPAWEEKYLDFKQIYDNWAATGEAVDVLWIGMYDYNPPQLNHTWIDCCELDSNFDLWALGEPNHADTEHCVRMVNAAEWKTKACDQKYSFVCEIETDGCTFEMLDESALRSNLSLEAVGTMSVEECKSHCQILHTPECLAFTVDTGKCLVHRAEGIYITTLPSTVSKFNAVTGVKRCYTYDIERNSSTTPEPDLVPLHICDVYQQCSEELVVTVSPTSSPSTTVLTDTSIFSFTVIDVSTTVSPQDTLSSTATTWQASGTLITTSLPVTPSSTQFPDSSTTTPQSSDFSITFSYDSQSTSNSDTLTELFSSFTLIEDFATTSLHTTIAFEISETMLTSEYILQTSNVPGPSSPDLEVFSSLDSTGSSLDQPMSTSTSVTTEGYSQEVTATVTTGEFTQEVTESCRCACFPKELKPDNLQMYVKRLVLERRKLSSYKRRVSSASDERFSARCIGWSFGIGILAFVACVIAFLDLSYVVQLFGDPNYGRRNWKHL